MVSSGTVQSLLLKLWEVYHPWPFMTLQNQAGMTAASMTISAGILNDVKICLVFELGCLWGDQLALSK